MTGRTAKTMDRIGDGIAAGLMFAILGVTTIFLEPVWGISFMGLALITMITMIAKFAGLKNGDTSDSE
jgi:hypothetical protein